MSKKTIDHSESQAKRIVRAVVTPILTPVGRFMAMEFATGLVMIAAMVIALVWANSPWAHAYFDFIHFPIGINIGHFKIQESLHFWVNDGLMAIFFFMVGMEIKRQFVIGELSSFKRAALPLFAALGGMVCPALIYYYLNPSGPAVSGWGIPMATDIAFAVGVLTLMSSRVPFGLKIFLLALAIADDLGAVLVIAIFYTNHLSFSALFAAVAVLGVVMFLNKVDVRNVYVYIFLGALAWLGLLYSGVHATVAGVLLGFINPLISKVKAKELAPRMIALSNKLEKSLESEMRESDNVLSQKTKEYLDEIRFMAVEAQSPLERYIEKLHPWVSFGIVPLFALVNAGVQIGSVSFSQLVTNPISLGVFWGLVIGKPVGIFIFSFLAVKLKIAELPRSVNWLQILGAGGIAGIGFTVALFVSDLALGNQPELEVFSKMGILLASVAATILGGIVLLFCPKVAK